MLAGNPSSQPWKDEILRELAKDVRLIHSDGKKLLFERTREETVKVKGKKRTCKVVRTLKAKRKGGEYIITKSERKIGKDVSKVRRNEKVSLEELISIMNGTAIEENKEPAQEKAE
jgi:hypothetical protein